MLRREHLAQGRWLFRHRSLLPVPLIVVVVASLIGGPAGQLSAGAPWWDLAPLLVGFIGLGIRAFALGHAPPLTSGGNLRLQVAEQLNRTGLYSVVRHPLYLGNLFLWIGVSLAAHSLWVALVTGLAFLTAYDRIMLAEERFLERQFPRTFRAWASATPALLPRLSAWLPPREPFAWRRILRREYNALASFAVVFATLSTLRLWRATGEFALSTPSALLLGVAGAAAAVCVAVKKLTRWLEAPATSVSAVGMPRELSQ